MPDAGKSKNIDSDADLFLIKNGPTYCFAFKQTVFFTDHDLNWTDVNQAKTCINQVL